MITNEPHPVRPLIGRFRPLRGDIQPPVCESRSTLSNYLIQPTLSRITAADLRAQKFIRPVFRLLQGSRRRAASIYDAIINIRRRIMSRFSLPARSLRGRPASLRTVPDGAGCLLRKWLFWRALLVMRPAILGGGPIFLPALRERGQGGGCRRSRTETFSSCPRTRAPRANAPDTVLDSPCAGNDGIA
jgi:hypothetical protein